MYGGRADRHIAIAREPFMLQRSHPTREVPHRTRKDTSRSVADAIGTLRIVIDSTRDA